MPNRTSQTEHSNIKKALARTLAELFGDDRVAANDEEIDRTADALRRVHRLSASTQIRSAQASNS